MFRRKFKNERENGMSYPEVLGKPRSWLIDRTTEIVPGVFASPNIRIVGRNDMYSEHFFVEIGDEMHPDAFEDELALILKSEESLSVLSVCSYRGITDIIRTVQTAPPGLGLKLTMGGFHIHNVGIEESNVISAFSGMKLPKRLGVCYCADIGKYALFRQQSDDRVFYSYTDWIETI